MIKATVLSGSKTAAAELPCDKYDLYEMLQSIGIRESAKRILLTDNEGDDIRVRLLKHSIMSSSVPLVAGSSDAPIIGD